ncbi:MAG: hypothetical protein HC825_12220 [Oscillatoriales cyanobacterium RM1_1_9]|nr:hypothetical protein [Oscillatoriales cyanobacterium RM1_1_9]
MLEPIHSNVTIAIRPEDIKFLGEVGAISSPLLDRPCLIANINSLEFLGAGYLVNVSLEGDSREEILVNLPIEIARKINFNSSQCRLALQLPPELIKIFQLLN